MSEAATEKKEAAAAGASRTPQEDRHALQQLAAGVQRLCARCEMLSRENATLKRENKTLREKNAKAKQRLSDLLATLPDYQ